MTRVELRFRLQSPLTEAQLERLAEARSVYGFLRIVVGDGSGGLLVEYDASRLTAGEVTAVLLAAGVPVLDN